MKDNELRAFVLQKYYDARGEGDFIPVNEKYFGSEIAKPTVLRICQQLAQMKLIEIKPFHGNDKILGALGKITATGVDVIEKAESEKVADKKVDQSLTPYVFLSYQTSQKHDAGKVKELLDKLGVKSFLAHEDIDVSQEWRGRILEELNKTNLFICLLSKEYYKSPWCVQESGIAAFRVNMTIIPISLDGSIPMGFISLYQSTKLTNGIISYKEVLPGLIKHDPEFGLDKTIQVISDSASFRVAENNFEIIVPHQDKLNNKQARELMTAIRNNAQIRHASICATKYIPPLLNKYGYLLSKEDFDYLNKICDEYINAKKLNRN